MDGSDRKYRNILESTGVAISDWLAHVFAAFDTRGKQKPRRNGGAVEPYLRGRADTAPPCSAYVCAERRRRITVRPKSALPRSANDAGSGTEEGLSKMAKAPAV